jgi:hypothetical protein
MRFARMPACGLWYIKLFLSKFSIILKSDPAVRRWNENSVMRGLFLASGIFETASLPGNIMSKFALPMKNINFTEAQCALIAYLSDGDYRPGIYTDFEINPWPISGGFNEKS